MLLAGSTRDLGRLGKPVDLAAFQVVVRRMDLDPLCFEAGDDRLRSPNLFGDHDGVLLDAALEQVIVPLAAGDAHCRSDGIEQLVDVA